MSSSEVNARVATVLARIACCVSMAIALLNPAATAFAGQGAVRMLYTVPNSTFIERPAGDTNVVTINDVSGSISTLQTSIDNARAANPGAIIVIRLLNGATYTVNTASLVLGSRECLVAAGATIRAANSSVTVPLVLIASGSTNVSVAGGALDGNGANINGLYAPAAARVNVDRVTVLNCGQDGILLKGNGNSTYDNQMTVTRCDVSGSALHAGISIQNSTETLLVDNYCHNNLAGIYLSCAWANVVNNVCRSNTTGIDIAGGSDNVVANNTCNHNGTGIRAAATKGMIASNSTGNNTTAGIASVGTSNNFIDNLFTAGNAVNFTSAGSANNVVAYKTGLNAPGQNYFYPPLINDQHTNLIMNGKGRTDLTIGSTTIDSVQAQYDAARAANPDNVIVLHLNGTFTVGATSLTLSANTCVLLNGAIQISAGTGASAAIKAASGSPSFISMSGGIIDGGNLTGNNGISISSASMVQIDAMTVRNFGPALPRSGGSDSIHLSGGSTPYIVTRCVVNGSSSRGIWLQLNGKKSVISENEVSNVNQDGVDGDSSTSGCVAKFNYCHDLERYGVFWEQSASHNIAIGNVCNRTGRGINVYNNYATPRGPTQYNTSACNSLDGNSNGIRNGSTGDTNVVSSHNFFFNNVVKDSSGNGIQSDPLGTQNYYSQNYLSGNGTAIKLSGTGAETFFNSPDVDGFTPVQDSNSGLDMVVQNAATTNNAPIVTGPASGLPADLWQFLPTDNGYYRVANKNSGQVLTVSGASPASGALMVQSPFSDNATYNDEWLIQPADNGLYHFVNRLSGLYLNVPGGSAVAGTQLDQQPSNGSAWQQFNITGTVLGPPPPFFLSAGPADQTVNAGSSTNYTVTMGTNTNFTGTVTFTLSGLPTNASASFTPPSLSAAGSSTLEVTTATNTPVGNFLLTITGTNGLGDAALATVSLNVTTPGSNLVWASTSSAVWDTATPNWFNELTGANDVFQNGKNVLFTDRTGVVTNVTLGGGVIVSPGAVVVDAETNNYTLSGAGKISGATGLVKSGSGSLTISTTNDFTGVTTLSGGLVTVPLLANGGSASGIGAAASGPANLVFDGGALRWTGGASVSVNRGFTLTLNGGTLDSAPPVSASLTLSGAVAFSGSGARTLTLAGTDPNPLAIGNNTISSVIADGPGGATEIVKVGNNAWNFSGNNTYSGGSFINAGRLRANTSAGAFGTGPVTVADGAQAYLAVGATFPNAFFIEGIGIPETEGNYGALRLASNNALVTNTVTLTGDARITARGAGAPGATIAGRITGDYSLEFGNSGGSLGVLILSNANNDWSGNTTISHGTVKLGVPNAVPHGLDKGDVFINGSSTSNSVFDLNGLNAVVNGLSSSGDASRVIISNSAPGAATITVGDNHADGAFGGAIRNGAGAIALTKIGGGVQTLSGVHAYTGATTISNGALVVNGSLASTAVSVQPGAVLSGNGAIGGNVTVNSGATLSPGNSIGALTIGGAVTLQGVTFMELDPTAATNDVVRSATAIQYGGTLSLTNLGGILASTDTFKLFDATGYSGVFANIVPASPGPGLAWSTNSLATDGTLRIVPSEPPFITGVVLSGSTLWISGTNGPANGAYYVLMATDLAVPVSNWTRLATNFFDGSGNFQFTNPPDGPRQFYLLQLP